MSDEGQVLNVGNALLGRNSGDPLPTAASLNEKETGAGIVPEDPVLVVEGSEGTEITEPVSDVPEPPKEPIRGKVDEDGEKAVPYERFKEVNEEAKLVRELKTKFGITNDQLKDFLTNPDKYMEPQVQQPSYEPSEDLVSRLDKLERKLRTKEQAEKESQELAETLRERPEVAELKDTIVELGRTKKYSSKSYSEIYDEIASKFNGSSATRGERRTALTQPLNDGMTELKFAGLSHTEKELYLKKIGALD